MNLIRADKFLTDRKLAESRTGAAELIRKGLIRINGQVISKPATMVSRDSAVTVDRPDVTWVSRGAWKLDHALTVFDIRCDDRTALDCGASTGGFTECLLRRGAKKVYAVDVGYGQLHWSLRQNPKVVVLERSNLRTMSTEVFDTPVDIATLDMSFISLKLVLEKVRDLLSAGGCIVALVKPQFEAGRDHVGSGGVVRDPQIHRQILMDMAHWSIDHGFLLKDITASPITGPKGNREFLFHLIPGSDTFSEKIEHWIEQAMQQ